MAKKDTSNSKTKDVKSKQQSPKGKENSKPIEKVKQPKQPPMKQANGTIKNQKQASDTGMPSKQANSPNKPTKKTNTPVKTSKQANGPVKTKLANGTVKPKLANGAIKTSIKITTSTSRPQDKNKADQSKEKMNKQKNAKTLSVPQVNRKDGKEREMKNKSRSSFMSCGCLLAVMLFTVIGASVGIVGTFHFMNQQLDYLTEQHFTAVSKLENELEIRRSATSKTESEKKTSAEELSRLTRELSDLRKSMDTISNKLKHSEAELSRSRKSAETLKESILRAEEERQRLENLQSANMNDITTLERELEARDHTIKEITMKYNEKERLNTQSLTNIKELEAKLETSLTRQQAAERKAAELEKRDVRTDGRQNEQPAQHKKPPPVTAN